MHEPHFAVGNNLGSSSSHGTSPPHRQPCPYRSARAARLRSAPSFFGTRSVVIGMQAAAGRSLTQTAAGRGSAPLAATAVRSSPPRPAALCHHLGLSSSSTGGLRAHRSGCSSPGLPSSMYQRRRAVQIQAAADAAAPGGNGTPGSLPSAPPAPQHVLQQKKPRELSLQQRWRAAKFAAWEVAQKLSQLPAIAALLGAIAALNARLQPLYDAWELLQRKKTALLELYYEFLLEETKRQWRWSKVNAKELAWWSGVPPYFAYLGATIVYEAFMPVSLLAAVLLPWWFAWVMWDDWWRSPVFLGLLLTAPLKWVPWAEMCLVWPGLI